MKVWYQHGSEHSANLVMIGHFEDASAAAKAKEVLDAITEQIAEDVAEGTLVVGSPPSSFGNAVLELLMRLDVFSMNLQELEQFEYEVNVEVEGNKVVVTTEEIEISAFFKVLFFRGARVEVFSAHDHSETGYGRGS